MENKNIVSTLGSSTGKIEHDNEIIAKYNGKRVRFTYDGSAYLYKILVHVGSEIDVRLVPMNSGDVATNHVNYGSYGYEMGHPVYKKAVQRADAIANEIEQSLSVDFEVE